MSLRESSGLKQQQWKCPSPVEMSHAQLRFLLFVGYTAGAGADWADWRASDDALVTAVQGIFADDIRSSKVQGQKGGSSK